MLTTRGMSLKAKGILYESCVRSVMVYGSETWAAKEEDIRRIERADLSMIRWMCNKSLRDRKASAELRERLGLLSIKEVISRNRLRWFGHVERMKLSSWARRIVEVEVPGSRSRGRPRKTWWETVSVDMRKRCLNRELAQDGSGWKAAVISYPG